MSNNDDLSGIDVGDCREMVHRAAQPPCPRSQRAPFTRTAFGPSREFQRIAANAVTPALEVIWFDIAIIERGDAIPSLDRHFDGPRSRASSPQRLGRAVVDYHALLGPHPTRWQRNGRVI